MSIPPPPHAKRKPKRAIFELLADPKALKTLPSLGTIVRDLTEMMGRPTTPLESISTLIRRDQSLSVRILRVANSAYYAPSEEILNLEQALLYCGLSQIRSSILTARCIEQTCDVPAHLFSWKSFWAHSVAVACVSRILGAHLKRPGMNGENFYVVGLLHDIGKLALAFLSPDDFELVLEAAKERNCELSRVEFDILGLDHAGLGAWYLEQQGLPPLIADCVRHHHSWQSNPEKLAAGAFVSLANRWAHELGLGASGSFYPPAESIRSLPEWMIYANLCGMAEDDLQLFSIVSAECEQLPSLVDQLTS